MLTKQRQAEFKAISVADGATQPGEFEALVAVFDNVDNAGDRIKSGAFDETLAAWRKSGDPIPIVLAHEWSDPWAHIGYAMPEDVKAIPGRGLYVSKGVLDIEDNPVAKQVHRLMERRTLKEFSFGYRVDEGGERKAEDGAYDLTSLTLIEFGPCLKGVNDSTELLAVKSLMAAEQRQKSGEEPTLEQRMERLETLVLQLGKTVTVSNTANTATTSAITAELENKGYHETPNESVVRAACVEHFGGSVEGRVLVEEITDSDVLYSVDVPGGAQSQYRVSYEIDSDDVVTFGDPVAVAGTASDETLETTDEEIETKADPEVSTEGAEDVQETSAADPEKKSSDEESARQKSAEIDLMLRMQALDNIEAEMGCAPEEDEPETKSLDEQLAEVEAEFADPMEFDVGKVRLKQFEDGLDALENGVLGEVIAKDQQVDDTQRALEEIEKELS